MLVFDQLKRNDPQLRLITVAVIAGLLVLLVGLWWVQIVSARDYQANLETQSFRTVRIPAVRGKILDRHGRTLAENRPVYNVSLYLEDLRGEFQKTYAAAKPKPVLTNATPFWKRWLGASKVTTKAVPLTGSQINALNWQVREQVARDTVEQVGRQMQQPLTLNLADFRQHYQKKLVLPFPIAKNIDATNIARFEEQSANLRGVDLEVQSARFYPNGTTAAHLLGHLTLDRGNDSLEGEASFFNYRLPDYRGVLGIEGGYELSLHGRAGEKSVLINNLGYRQTENIWTPAEPGSNVVLTIDLAIQSAAEQALPVLGPETRGAAVVMDVHTGDILAMVSAPAVDPNVYVRGFTAAEYARIQELGAEKNRATQENYAPGSIFKTLIGLAALENGLNPRQKFNIATDPANPAKGISYVNGHAIHDPAPPGEHDFRRALKLSSNSYFIMQGLHAGISNIIHLGERLHLGERMKLPTRQESAGYFPSAKRIAGRWFDGDTANLCIGQGEIAVTPLQMTVLAAALANGGKVIWPRLVDRIEPQNLTSPEQAVFTPISEVRDNLGVKPGNLKILREAMLADTEDADGTGRAAALPGIRICGKTGTAQVKNQQGKLVQHITWFLSFAPYEKPRYAVVVMIEGGASGGRTCAPVAQKIYEAILESEKPKSPPTLATVK